jgi:hypothetical protein
VVEVADNGADGAIEIDRFTELTYQIIAAIDLSAGNLDPMPFVEFLRIADDPASAPAREELLKCTATLHRLNAIAVSTWDETGEYWRALNTPAEQHAESDGPVVGFRWRRNGELIEGTMQPAAWRMVNHLWKQPDRSASFDGLKVPVYDDSDHVADASNFGALRKAANKYFRVNSVPLRITIKKTAVSLTAAE